MSQLVAQLSRPIDQSLLGLPTKFVGRDQTADVANGTFKKRDVIRRLAVAEINLGREVYSFLVQILKENPIK